DWSSDVCSSDRGHRWDDRGVPPLYIGLKKSRSKQSIDFNDCRTCCGRPDWCVIPRRVFGSLASCRYFHSTVVIDNRKQSRRKSTIMTRDKTSRLLFFVLNKMRKTSSEQYNHVLRRLLCLGCMHCFI